MKLNSKQKKLLDNTLEDAEAFLKTRSKYLFKEDILDELRRIGQYNIIEKHAGYPESLKLMWHWRQLADELLEEVEADELIEGIAAALK
jgi:hypothetical protein